MTFSVYQHWDPLKVCVVGRSYPPEFYSWINVSHVRKLFEKIAIETEEDYQNIIKKLKEFGVEVLRPDLPEQPFKNNRYKSPPMTPRDYTCMVGQTFYETWKASFYKSSYSNIKDASWPDCNNWEEFNKLPQHIQNECVDLHHWGHDQQLNHEYDKIFKFVQQQGNQVVDTVSKDFAMSVNGAMVTRIGKDLYFGTDDYDQDTTLLKTQIDLEFPDTRNHVVNTGGHADGTFCPVCPGLIISLEDAPTYQDTFPGWEVVYLPGQGLSKVMPFMQLKQKNHGRWWIPGFENDQAVIDVVETWLGHWTGYVEETVFDVNMLIIDPKNVMVFGYNQQVFDALDRYGVTPHIVPFRHRYFWDGGIHCVTSDLHRDGTMHDYFPERKL